ncbi:MAG: PaaI family thioesterase [Spirochaetaceae bacterium]|nr:MAG: PaaI family thioesterase [Spirochaetaceae bacterium]
MPYGSRRREGSGTGTDVVRSRHEKPRATIVTRLTNPYIGLDGYNCFGCAPTNTAGLKLEFYLDGESVVAIWHPDRRFVGYGNIVHGGIQATLLDEVGAWAVNVLVRTAGVTRRMTTEYRTPVYADRGPVKISASIDGADGKVARVSARILDADGAPCVEAGIEYALFSESLARKRLNYPGYEAFLPGRA